MSDEPQAGRELDALIAERVMGWKWVTQNLSHKMNLSLTGPLSRMLTRPDMPTRHDSYFAAATMQEPLDEMWYEAVPHYSTEIKDAWEVVEKMQANASKVSVFHIRGEGWAAYMHFDVERFSVYERANTAPLAICRAALAA